MLKDSIKLKSILMLSHAIIILGIGHGIVPIAFFELILLDSLFPDLLDVGAFSTSLILIGAFALLGQILIVTSIFLKSLNLSKFFHLFGLISLTASIAALFVSADSNSTFHVVKITMIPFIIAMFYTVFCKTANRVVKSSKH